MDKPLVHPGQVRRWILKLSPKRVPQIQETAPRNGPLLSNRAIASRLFVTERTVEAHVTQIFQKLGLDADPDSHRRVLAVLAYLRAS